MHVLSFHQEAVVVLEERYSNLGITSIDTVVRDKLARLS